MNKQLCKIMLIFTLLFVQIFSLRVNHQNEHIHQGEIHKIRSNQKQSNNLKQHDYFNLQETNRVSSSKSLKYLEQCKNICLEMHQIFPFEFKYHRLVYRQTEGDMKYITGQCFYTFRENLQKNKKDQNSRAQNRYKVQNENVSEKKWHNWKQLKSFIDLSVVQDNSSKQQRKAWESYSKDCQDESLKLSESSRIDFKFTIVHSDFQYYQNQGFKNLQPFNDFDQLLSGLPSAL